MSGAIINVAFDITFKLNLLEKQASTVKKSIIKITGELLKYIIFKFSEKFLIVSDTVINIIIKSVIPTIFFSNFFPK